VAVGHPRPLQNFPGCYVQLKDILRAGFWTLCAPYMLVVIKLAKKSELPHSCYRDCEVFFWYGGAQGFCILQLSSILVSFISL
jgi:hypothetical protein